MAEPAKGKSALQDDKEFVFLRRPSAGYLFLVTYGRSGSTLTQNLLNSIPGYCIRGENANAIYQMCKLVDNMQRETNFTMRREQAQGKSKPMPELGLPTDPWYGCENIDIDRLAKRMFNVFSREVLIVPPQTRVAGFKEIRYLQDVAFIPRQLEIMQHYFPRARIVFLTRDHTEVADSSWWRGHEKQNLLPRLAKADAAFKDYTATHEDCFHLDYATYAEGPEALKPLFDFLGEEFDAQNVARILGQKLTHGTRMKKLTEAQDI